MTRPVSPEDLAALHPRLYHLAVPGTLDGVRRHGLLPTARLLDLFGVPEADRAAIEGARRPASVVLRHPVHGTATVTDNLPLHENALRACLDDGLQPADWFRILNGRVFLWADEAGLARLLHARTVRGRAREVLEFDTLSLARRHHDRIELSAINSGATLRRPARRGLSTFTPMDRHTYPEWRRLRGRRDRILEVTVVGGIPDAADLVAASRIIPAA